MRNIGKNIKDIRVRKNFSQEEVAEKLFVTRQTVSNYETGKSKPDVETLIRLADIFETDVTLLIYGEERILDARMKGKIKHAVVDAVIIAAIFVISILLYSYSKKISIQTVDISFRVVCGYVIRPILVAFAGACVIDLVDQFAQIKPFTGNSKGRIAAWLFMILTEIVGFLLFMIIALPNILNLFGLNLNRFIHVFNPITEEVTSFLYFENWMMFILFGLVFELARRLLAIRKRDNSIAKDNNNLNGDRKE